MIHALSVLLGFVVAFVVILVVWVLHSSFHGRRRRMAVASDASDVSHENIAQVFRKHGGLPFWLKNPEVLNSNVEFVNSALKLLWPRIDRAGTPGSRLFLTETRTALFRHSYSCVISPVRRLRMGIH
jgi:hypothetical protein